MRGCLIPERYKGCTVAIVQLNDTNYRNFNFVDYVKVMAMSLDTAAFHSYPPEGLFLILDNRGCSLMHLAQVKISLIKSFLKYIQDAIPVQVKEVHVVYSNYVTQAIFNLIKPFIKIDAVQHIYFHSVGNMDLFYENHLPKRYLPREFGGELESMELYSKLGLQSLSEMEAYFEFEEKQRNSIKRCEESKNIYCAEEK